MAVYTLPELPYDYAALEPHISGKIMELHHDKHHAAYVAGANAALVHLSAGGDDGDDGGYDVGVIKGSGWAVLAYDSLSGKLVTFQLFDQQGNVPVGTIPLFMVDMWEHAFYLDYLNVKADYVKAVWNIANWQDVAERLADAVAKTRGIIVR